MRVKVNEHIICIPPYISAKWNQIAFIEAKDSNESLATLHLHLTDGTVVEIPNLDKSVVDVVFNEHLRFLENSQARKEVEKKEDEKVFPLLSLIQQITKSTDVQILSAKSLLPLPGTYPLEMILQHIPEHKDHSDAPTDVLEKMADLTKNLASNIPGTLPTPEPHCNCLHCQVGRFIEEENDSTVSESDLSFRSWDIVQNGENMYVVTNPLNPKEQFSVYLGTPIGCTCGQTACEHIEAVLYT
ncbi:hypothetical protein [Chlamydiifrater volucris]|uniref:hypothetical protein n=1 Tax=Chlamydiifrater volucris TaxID=2681470 RepID=UPI001BD02E1E|nr:hypothetical protein [Chlamydiifrater volucris]